MNMYLSRDERNVILKAYGYGDLSEANHYQVEPDTWVYLFIDENGNKYILISADFLDFNYDHFPYLLRFNNFEFKEKEFVLQREIEPVDVEMAAGTILFEYTD